MGAVDRTPRVHPHGEPNHHAGATFSMHVGRRRGHTTRTSVIYLRYLTAADLTWKRSSSPSVGFRVREAARERDAPGRLIPREVFCT